MTEIRLPRLRPSLRVNAVLMVLGMLILPQAIVVAWSAMERDIGGNLQWSAKGATEEVMDALSQGDPDEERIRSVAAKHTARVRIVTKDGRVLYDVDRDRGTDLVHQVGMLFFGPDGAPTLAELDATLDPVTVRPEVLAVTGWDPKVARKAPAPAEAPTHVYPLTTVHTGHAAPVSKLYASSVGPPGDVDVTTGCRTSPGGKLLLCHAARALRQGDDVVGVVYVQESSRRAVRTLYDLRYQLLRLSVLMLPLALLFSWWMGRRMVKPIEWLREQVLEKAKTGSPRADLGAPEVDEVADLAKAFNDLLHSLDDKRRQNEAFVADLVHEFKNPVAAIRASAESLGGGAVDEKRAQRLARILEDSSARLDALVSQFLELARAEAGMPNEARADVDVAALAKGVVASAEGRFPDVRFVVEAGEPAVVSGVETRLDSLLRNLVDNAASFAGEVKVTVAHEREGRDVAVEVSDNGPGIAEKDQPRVFDRFFTTRGAGERKDKGTGLGLALVKAVAEAHGGDVSARSKPGEGATFRVVLPSR